MKRIHLVAAAFAAALTVFIQQAGAQDHSAHHAPTAALAQAEPLSEGEVRKVDLEKGKVTLRHGPLSNLNMPAMTMAFTAADKKLLEGLKEGDKVKFTADKQGPTLVVKALQVVR
jgi:Cu(I)/Ag(I) efflux system periplasmic protein CusF